MSGLWEWTTIYKMPDVLNWVAHSKVIVKNHSRELFWELVLQNLFGERGIVDFGSFQCQSDAGL